MSEHRKRIELSSGEVVEGTLVNIIESTERFTDVKLEDGTVLKRFSLLRERWYVERGAASSISHIVGCDSYQKIIKLGKRALPLILSQLRQEGDDPDHWFVALESITGEDPIPKNAYGNMKKMAEAWLSWSERNDVW